MGLHQIELKIGNSDSLVNVLSEQLTHTTESTALHKTEDNVYTQLLQIGKKALQKYVDSIEENLDEAPVQSIQGEDLPYKKKAEREYLSIFGPITIKRAYYWKSGCETGIYPLDRQLELPEGKFSYLLQDMTLKLIISGPYQEALETIHRIFKVQLWPQAVQAILERGSSYVNSFYKGIKNYEETEGPVIAVTMDCKGIPMVPSERFDDKSPKQHKVRREKGDKRKGLRRDAVVTSHFTFYPETRTPQELLKALMHQYTEQERKEHKLQAKKRRLEGKLADREPINKQVHAAMDGKEKAFERLADQVLHRNPTQDKKIIVLIDGASSLENRFKEEIKKRHWKGRVDGYILDIFHALEYLWTGGAALYGEKNPQRQAWVADKLLAILEGRVGRVIGAIRQLLKKDKRRLKSGQKNILQTIVTYFDNHRHMMQYNIYLQKGYPIGTGVVEGACGCLVKDRTDRSGMKWSHDGVQAILNLRAVNQNGDWDKYFSYYVNMENQRLYKETIGSQKS